VSISGYSFDDRQIRMILPHRPPLLQVDRVERCAVELDDLVAVKLVDQI
jgi:3-hydroxymyristoyl/3-hydroxydecanoyl-(acyl carrier protein) dehydratase